MTNHKEFESWCKTTGHDYCFDLNQSGKYQWGVDQGAYEAFCYGLPQQRTWRGLTNAEWLEIVEAESIDTLGTIKNAIEAKLKEKNT